MEGIVYVDLRLLSLLAGYLTGYKYSMDPLWDIYIYLEVVSIL